MSWTFDDALEIPPTNALRSWFYSSSSRAVHPPIDITQYPRRFDLLELTSIASFWDELGRGSLTRAVASLCAGMARINARLLVSFQRDGPALSMIIGVGAGQFGGSGALFDVATPIIKSTLPSARLRRLTPGSSPILRLFRTQGAVALAGTPRLSASPPERPLIEALDAAGVDHWSLTVEAEPVDPYVLNNRLLEIDLRIQDLAHATGVSTRVSPTATRTDRNVDVDNVITLLGRERERAQSALRRGGYVVTTWLTAESTSTVVALAGAATSALAPTSVEPRGLVVLGAQRGGEAPGTFLTADELATLVHPPLHDLPGFRVAEWSRFDESPETDSMPAITPITIGTTERGVALAYPTDRLTGHALVSGITGSGKSSFISALLNELTGASRPIPFLIIEPTKDEYRRVVDPARTWSVGDPASTRFRLNPFEVPPGTPVQTHVDVLIALFASSFALIAPLPFVLELAMRQAYEARGWDFATNTNSNAHLADHPLFPSFSEVLEAGESVIDELGYQGEVRHNIRGALQARLGAMTVGAKGRAFDTDRPFDLDEILRSPFLVNLDLIGSDEEKAFIIGLLLVRLWEARRGTSSRTLDHLVVLEEAHRILRREPSSGNGDQRGGAAFASELFANMLAEVRGAGQGVVVIDQSPRKLSTDALANTALKVAFRTTFDTDKTELAGALNLDDSQRRALTGLPTHLAVVFWEGMDRPVLASMARHFPAPTTKSVAAASATSPPASRVLTKSLPPSSSLTPGRPTRSRPSAAIGDLAAALLRADDVERVAIRRELTRVGGSSSSDAAFDASRAEIERLGVARRWSPQRRDWLASHVTSTDDAVREQLLDHSSPMRACSSVCSTGGCLARESVRRTALARSADVRLAREWLSAPTAVIVNRMKRELGALGRDDLAPNLASIAIRCLAAHILEDRVPDSDVEDVLRRLG